MIDCDKVLTHVSFELDPVTRTKKMKFEQVGNCSWNRTRKIREVNKSVEKDTITKIRIPLLGRANVPEIEPGDYMIKGEVTTHEFASVGDLLKKYPEHSKINDVSYNTDCRPYSQHIRLEGD